MKKNLSYKLIVLLFCFVMAIFFHSEKLYAIENESQSQNQNENEVVTNLKGDFNGDGKKDITDVLILLRHIAANKSEAVKQKYPTWYKEDKQEEMDLNNDGKIDVTDCLTLQRHIASDKDEEIAFQYLDWNIKDIVPEELELNLKKATICLTEEKVIQLIPYVVSTNEELFTDLTWESSNPEVATVSNSGKVTGISEGTSTIKVKAKNGIEATCEVTVQQGIAKIVPETILLDKLDLEVELKQSEHTKFQYRISPSNANTDTQLEWISSNPDVIIVDQQGKITPKAEGNAVIIVKTANEKTSMCNVVVKDTKQETEIYPEELTNETPEIKITLNENAYTEMKTHITPSNANAGTTITYTSSDTSIVQVDNAGVLRGIKEGTCIITATTENGKTTQSTITVENAIIVPQNVSINEQGPIQLKVDDTAKLTATITPDNAEHETGLKWESDNENIAKVDSNGVIKAIQEGSCIITVTTENGKTANVTINVESKNEKIVPTEINIVVKGNDKLQNVKVKETIEMQATITPSNANTNTKITWKSSNAKVAVVDAKGKVQAKAAGDCTITATTENGISDSYEIKVYNATQSEKPATKKINPTKVKIEAKGSKSLPNMKVNETAEMKAVITPSNANTNTKIKWTSSNSNVAVVNAQGVVRARAAGQCKITATTGNGKTNSYTIKVQANTSKPKKIAPTSVSINVGGQTVLQVNKTKKLTATISPNNANTSTSLKWKSSNKSVATVNNNGVVTALKSGSCTITVTTANGKSNTCTITVKKKVVEPKSISIKAEGSTKLKKNNSVKLNDKVAPENANTNTKVTWKSTDSKVAVVNNQGLVQAKGIGKCQIKATTGNNKSSACTVEVVDNAEPKVQIKSSYDGSIITGGAEVTYEINIVDENLKTFDKSKVKLTGDLKDKATLKVEGSGKKYIATVGVPDDSGKLGIMVDDGAAIDKTNLQSKKVQYHNMDDYVFTLNETTADKQITVAVGVINSFYVKDYEFYLDNTKKIGGRTTNEYTYTGLKTGQTYKVKVRVNVYKDKKTNDTISGWLEKDITVEENDGVEVHFIDVTYKNKSTADCIFIKTRNGKTIMIDAGPNKRESGGEVVRIEQADNIDKYLRVDKKGRNGENLVTEENGVVKVDYLIITHKDLDHAGGLPSLTGLHYKADGLGYRLDKEHKINGKKRRYDFGKIVLGCNVKEYGTNEKPTVAADKYSKMTYCYAKHTNKLMKVTAGNVLKIDNIVLNIFNPYDKEDVPNAWITSSTNAKGEKTDGVRQKPIVLKKGDDFNRTTLTEANNNSVVTKLICGSAKALLTGDAEFYVEEILLGIPAEQVARKKKERGNGLLVESSASKDHKTYVSLVADLLENNYGKCKNLDALENKYKLSRLTAKDVSAKVLKKGHHGYAQSTSTRFLNAVKPNKIIATAIKHEKSVIPCVEVSVDYRIRGYYNKNGNGTSTGKALKINKNNWKNSVFGTGTHGSFYIETKSGTAWGFDDPYEKAKKIK